MREPVISAALVPMRVFVGWVYLSASLQKLSDGWLDRDKLTSILQAWMREGHTYRFFSPLLRELALPHAQTLGRVIACGELLVGATLLAGLFTRVGAFSSLLMSLAYMLARGDGLDANPTVPFVVMSLTLLLTHSGRVLGLDAALADRVPRWLT